MFGIRKILDKIFYIKEKSQLQTKHLFNFGRVWKVLFFFTAGVAILPLLFFAYIDYQVSYQSINSEISLTTSRLTNNMYHFISYFIDERKKALEFIVHNNSFDKLQDTAQLTKILNDLQTSFGGFSDLGIIDEHGTQLTYVGPYQLEGKDYSKYESFDKTIDKGFHVSEVFLGYRNVPHLAFSVIHKFDDDSFFILRTTIEDRFINIIKQIKTTEKSDAFIVNDSGILQTSSKFFGDALEPINSNLLNTFNDSTVSETTIGDKTFFVSSLKIEHTPFHLMVLQQKDFLIKPWYDAKVRLVEYLVISILFIIIWIVGVTTYVVKRLKVIDKRRINNLRMIEHAGRMASIGKLAAGVAHEINNPLAIINEKAGYCLDKFELTKEFAKDEKVIKAINSIIANVERCGRITKRLLHFSRQDKVYVGAINLAETVQGLLDFVHKEAQYRRITFSVLIPEDFPTIYTDKGKLEQIVLNLINNGIDAMKNGGNLVIKAVIQEEDKFSIIITDTGIGIPKENLDKIFEPFYTTKPEKEGTGLGLSITSSLINELGGKIKVDSRLNEFTTFEITLPVNIKNVYEEK